MKQKIFGKPHGWSLMVTWGQCFGLGFFTSSGWLGLRCNGVDLMVGPLTLTVRPPTPKWLLKEMQSSQ